MDRQPDEFATDHQQQQRMVDDAEPRHVVDHAVLAAVYASGLAVSLGRAHRRGRLPERIDTRDILLLGVAAFRMSRLVSRNRVADFLRAPFMYPGPKVAPNEVQDAPRPERVRGAIGELIQCPFCISAWMAAGLLAGLVHAPRATRSIGSLAAMLAVSDVVQQGYVLLDKLREQEVHEAERAQITTAVVQEAVNGGDDREAAAAKQTLIGEVAGHSSPQG